MKSKFHQWRSSLGMSSERPQADLIRMIICNKLVTHRGRNSTGLEAVGLRRSTMAVEILVVAA
jgi:hypothetical protein